MEKEILYENQALGRCTIEKVGGYYRVDARCTYKDGIFRLYMQTPQKFTRLGVMMPEAGELRLTRRISPYELGLAPEDGALILMRGALPPPPMQTVPAAAVPAPEAGASEAAAASETEAEASEASAASPVFEGSEASESLSEAEAPPEAEAAQTVPAAEKPAEADETQKARTEGSSDPSSGPIDRWCECENAAELTGDPVLKPLLAALTGVLYRYRGGGVELAIPEQESGAISAVLCLSRAEEIRGSGYFVVSLDRQGFPAPAIPPSRY